MCIKHRMTACVLTCLMIVLAGCSSTAKEAPQETTNTTTSFAAGNAAIQSGKKTAEEQESIQMQGEMTEEIESQIDQEEAPITAEENLSIVESQTTPSVRINPVEQPEIKTPEQGVEQAVSERQTEQPTAEVPKETPPTEPAQPSFDVSSYVSFAKEYER